MLPPTSKQEQQQEQNDRQPELTLSFHGLTYDVALKSKQQGGGGTKRILHGLSSAFHSGRFAAIMGPSGAGKSSLLDILAGVKLAGKAGGEVRLNGAPRRQARFAALASYVQQQDVLVPSATVREALLTSALLKLPRGMSRAAKVQRVEELLGLLELAHVADSLIGDPALGIKGISGGEKRRVSVGIEVVKDPAIIFLDEPTTGLDSEMALGVVTSLKAMARSGKMVVATIHQPNSLITDTFDDFVLLARGQLLYEGPWAAAVPHFAAAGFDCPLYRNPTDFFMTLASSGDAIRVLAEAAQQLQQQQQQPEGGRQGAPNQLLPAPSKQQQQQGPVIRSYELAAWPADAAAAAADLEAGSSSGDSADGTTKVPGAAPGTTTHPQLARSATAATLEPPPPPADAASTSHDTGRRRLHTLPACGDALAHYMHQVAVLMARFARSWLRTPIMAYAEAAQYAFLAVFLGLLYLRSPLALPDAPFDRMGAIFVVLVMLSLIPSYTVLVMWDSERCLLRRESSTNMYSRSAFFLAKTLTTTPIEVAQVSLFAAVTYFMFGFQASAAKFGVWWLTLVVFCLCSETLGYISAILTPDSKVGVALLSIILLLLLSFSGFLVRRIPVYFQWLAKASYFTFASAVLVENEFTGLTFSSSELGSVPGAALIPAAMTTGLSLGGNLAVLCGITVGARIVCLLLLEAAAHWRFL